MTRLGLLLSTVLLCGCAATTYDESVHTPARVDTVPAQPVSTDPAIVIPVLLTEVGDLARRVVDNDGAGAAATRIEELWAAIEPTVRDVHPELVSGFDFVVRRCRAAADHNRPADADRALKNLQALAESYLA